MAEILLINDRDIKIFGIMRIKQETKRMETKDFNIMWPPLVGKVPAQILIICIKHSVQFGRKKD